MACKNDNQEDLFDSLITKFTQLVIGRKEGDRARINKALDNLNSLNYRYPVITNTTKAVLLINQCCTLVPYDDSLLVAKCCHLITNLVNCQQLVVEGRTLIQIVQWCLQALKQSNSVAINVLVPLTELIWAKPQNIKEAIALILHPDGNVLKLAQSSELPEVTLLAVQCLESCTYVLESEDKTVEKYYALFGLCTDIFLKYLTSERTSNFESLLHCKLLISCLKGLQNIILYDPNFLRTHLELIIGIIKSYMVYGLKDVNFIVPTRVLPSLLSIPEPTINTAREKKGGKVAKQRKHRTSSTNKKETKKTTDWVDYPKGYVPANGGYESTSDTLANTFLNTGKLKTSDSDFSDTEGGRKAKLNITEGRVRQASLELLVTVAKSVEKRTIFSYWSILIPDTQSTTSHYLTTCILKDPSARGRMVALNVLLILLTSSKLYLSQAEASAKTTSFTPLSTVLGFTVKELHRCLCLALSENSVPVLLQALKCVAALVQATPYHKLEPGLITKVVRNVKGYIHHRDATIQVASLIVLGCILSSEPSVPETKEAFLKSTSQKEATKPQENEKKVDATEDFDFVDFSSDEEEVIDESSSGEMSWLLAKCLANLGVLVTDQKNPVISAPAPVKLESLQVLSAMFRNYFSTLMVPYMNLITKAIDISLADKYTDLRLHAGRTVDFVGQALNQHLNSKDAIDSKLLEQGAQFWQTLLNSSLVAILQEEQHPALRAVGCDCLGSIGPHIFERLPTDRQILTVTLLLACSRDGENSVRGAAVRALAICVLYPSLREDSGFVIDTAEVIYTTLQDDNMTVRIKASWALGNLSDAFVLNRPNSGSLDEVPNSLLLKLLESGIKGCSDSDKIRVNTVRALGNFLLLVSSDLMENDKFKAATMCAIDVLVQNSSSGSNMKVRWNSCYALSNLLKNNVIFSKSKTWQNSVYQTLMELVVNCKNFKVRINAALALSSPNERSAYGQFYIPVWTALLKALENSQNMDDFTEYKHRDNLVDQICLTIGHLAALLCVEDLTSLHGVIVYHFDLLKMHTQRVLERLIPERLTPFFTASTFVTSLLSEDISNEQKQTLKLFSEVFVYDL